MNWLVLMVVGGGDMVADPLEYLKVANSEESGSVADNTASKGRPDADGYLTFLEARDWSRNGNGQP